MEWLSPQEVRIFLQLLLAVFLGGLIGIEREYVGKAAGVRTYALVCLGATLFTILSREAFQNFIGKPGVSIDPTRIAGQVVLGIGFIGAGLIIFRGFRIEGLTTAAGLWVSAAIGMAIGAEFYSIAIFTAALVFIILEGLGRLDIENFLSRILGNRKDNP